MATAVATRNIPVAQLMTTEFVVVNPWDTLGEAVERMAEKNAGWRSSSTSDAWPES